VYYEVVSGYRLRPEINGVDVAFFGTVAPCASRLIEHVDAGVALVRWARGPFPVSGVRRDSGHTYPVHGDGSFVRGPEGDVVEAAPYQPEVMRRV
jgi:hypothetical protein